MDLVIHALPFAMMMLCVLACLNVYYRDRAHRDRDFEEACAPAAEREKPLHPIAPIGPRPHPPAITRTRSGRPAKLFVIPVRYP